MQPKEASNRTMLCIGGPYHMKRKSEYGLTGPHAREYAFYRIAGRSVWLHDKEGFEKVFDYYFKGLLR